VILKDVSPMRLLLRRDGMNRRKKSRGIGAWFSLKWRSDVLR
jgi:hypothetical protein